MDWALKVRAVSLRNRLPPESGRPVHNPDAAQLVCGHSPDHKHFLREAERRRRPGKRQVWLVGENVDTNTVVKFSSFAIAMVIILPPRLYTLP